MGRHVQIRSLGAGRALACGALLSLGLLACAGHSSDHAPGTPATGGAGDEGGTAQPGTGGTSGTSGTGGTSGTSGTGGSTPASVPDASPIPDAPTGGAADVGKGTMSMLPDAMMSLPDGGSDGVPDSAFLTGRPDIRLCKKEWTQEQCCAFLCSCLDTICADSAKAKAGLATCMSWCPKISDMAARCHVYHCYVSISPTGGIKDHDSHCGHAANQVQGGGCPTEVYQ
jgi:hypothetical protein